MTISRWKVMAGVLGVSIGGLAAVAGQGPKPDAAQPEVKAADKALPASGGPVAPTTKPAAPTAPPIDLSAPPPVGDLLVLPGSGVGSAPKVSAAPPAPVAPPVRNTDILYPPPALPVTGKPDAPKPEKVSTGAPVLPALPAGGDVPVVPAAGHSEPTKLAAPVAVELPTLPKPTSPAVVAPEPVKPTPTPSVSVDAVSPPARPVGSTSPPALSVVAPVGGRPVPPAILIEPVTPAPELATEPVHVPAPIPGVGYTRPVTPAPTPTTEPAHVAAPASGSVAAGPALVAAAAPSKFRIVLRVGDGEPMFEVRHGDDLVMKVVSEKVDIKSPEKGQGMSNVTATGKVRFVGFGAEGTCESFSFLAGTGEVSMSGNVKVQVKDKIGRVESELTTEKMQYRVDSSALPGMLKP